MPIGPPVVGFMPAITTPEIVSIRGVTGFSMTRGPAGRVLAGRNMIRIVTTSQGAVR